MARLDPQRYDVAKLRREKAFAGPQVTSVGQDVKELPTKFALGFEDSAHALQQLAAGIPGVGKYVDQYMPYKPATDAFTLGGLLGPTNNPQQNKLAYNLAVADRGNRPIGDRAYNDAMDMWSWFIAPAYGKAAQLLALKAGGKVGMPIAKVLSKRFTKGATDLAGYMGTDEIISRLLGR